MIEIKGLAPGDILLWSKRGEWMDVEIVDSLSYRVLRSAVDCRFDTGGIYNSEEGFDADGRWIVVKAKEHLFDSLYERMMPSALDKSNMI